MDISLSEELQELRSIVKGQQDKIQHLKEEISKQGIFSIIQDWQVLLMMNPMSKSKTKLKKWKRKSRQVENFHPRNTFEITQKDPRHIKSAMKSQNMSMKCVYD